MGKKWKAAKAAVGDKLYGLQEAIEVVKRTAYAKFDETVEMALRLSVDPKRSDQMVRGSVVLPHGTGVKVRILVFAKGDKEKEARDAGAEIVGGERHKKVSLNKALTAVRPSVSGGTHNALAVRTTAGEQGTETKGFRDLARQLLTVMGRTTSFQLGQLQSTKGKDGRCPSRKVSRCSSCSW